MVPELLTPVKAAEVAGVLPETIAKWFDRGMVSGVRREIRPGRHGRVSRLVDPDSLTAYLRARQAPRNCRECGQWFLPAVPGRGGHQQCCGPDCTTRFTRRQAIMKRAADQDLPGCRHCGHKPANRPRTLCVSCSMRPEVRERYPSGSIYAQHGVGADVADAHPLPAEATLTLPGSMERQVVYAARAERGEALHHPLDRRREVESIA